MPRPRFFAHANGSGMPELGGTSSTARLRGILSPHIDFVRGGPTYTWSYRELVEQSDADTFVILGVAHQQSRRRFVLTRKDFETPLGLAKTDATLADAISGSTWRQWAYPWDATSGRHVLRVRATDANGTVQTATERDPFPNAATGYHQIVALVN